MKNFIDITKFFKKFICENTHNLFWIKEKLDSVYLIPSNIISISLYNDKEKAKCLKIKLHTDEIVFRAYNEKSIEMLKEMTDELMQQF